MLVFTAETCGQNGQLKFIQSPRSHHDLCLFVSLIYYIRMEPGTSDAPVSRLSLSDPIPHHTRGHLGEVPRSGQNCGGIGSSDRSHICPNLTLLFISLIIALELNPFGPNYLCLAVITVEEASGKTSHDLFTWDASNTSAGTFEAFVRGTVPSTLSLGRLCAAVLTLSR